MRNIFRRHRCIGLRAAGGPLGQGREGLQLRRIHTHEILAVSEGGRSSAVGTTMRESEDQQEGSKAAKQSSGTEEDQRRRSGET